MSRTGVVPIDAEASEHAGTASLIDWPLPPFQEAAGDVAPVFEGAMVTFRDGRRLAGRLMRFSPATGVMEFCHDRAAIAQVLALSDILELRLVRPMRVRAQVRA